MTLEEVKKFLKEDASGKTWLQDQLDSATEELKSKNTELISINKRFKEDRDNYKAKVGELEELVNDKPDVQGQIEKATKKLQKDNEELQKKLDDSSLRIHKLVVENGLSDAIGKANIAKQYSAAVKALIKAENKIEIDDVDNVAKVNGKTLGEFLQEWTQSDTGKHYVAASHNSGGGAVGNNGKSPSVSDDIMKMSPIQRIQFARSK